MIACGSAMHPLEGISMALELWLGREQTCMLLAFVGLTTWLAMIPDLRRSRALAWKLAAYLATILVWSWPPNRFLVPILPFLAAYLLMGWETMLTAWKNKTGCRVVGAVGLAIILLANIWLLDCHAAHVRQNHYSLARLEDTPFNWSSYERTFAWLRRNSRPEDVIASGLDSMFALYTDRRASSIIPAACFTVTGRRVCSRQRSSRKFSKDTNPSISFSPRWLALRKRSR
jgi:hypothetical protein